MPDMGPSRQGSLAPLACNGQQEEVDGWMDGWAEESSAPSETDAGSAPPLGSLCLLVLDQN